MENKLIKTKIQIQKFIDQYQKDIEISENILNSIFSEIKIARINKHDVTYLAQNKYIEMTKLEISKQAKLNFELLLELF